MQFNCMSHADVLRCDIVLAMRRLPASKTPRQRLQVVAAAIDVLGLDDVRHQLIGNEEVHSVVLMAGWQQVTLCSTPRCRLCH